MRKIKNWGPLTLTIILLFTFTSCSSNQSGTTKVSFLKDSKTVPAELAEACAKDFKYSYTRNEFDRSDHVPFAENGIGEVFFECGPFTGYHTDKDNISVIQKDALVRVCNVATSIANEMAKNPDKYTK